MNRQRPTQGVNAAETKVGAVMVVGGGIAGIQAALDLAESGFYVYLVEKSSSCQKCVETRVPGILQRSSCKGIVGPVSK